MEKLFYGNIRSEIKMLLKLYVIGILGFILLFFWKACLFTNNIVRVKKVGFWIIVFSISMAGVAFHFEPSRLDDLYRYFRLGEQMIEENSIWGWLYPGINNLTVWRLLLGTSVLFQDVHAIPMSVVFFIILFWGLGICLNIKQVKITNLELFLYICISIGMIGWLPIFSWLRCTLAYAIGAYVTLFYCYKKKIRVVHLVLIICSLLLHPSIVIPLGVFMVSQLINKNTGIYYLMLGWSALSNVIIKLLKSIPNEYIQLLANGAEGYLKERAVNDYRLIITKLLFSILIVCYFTYLKIFEVKIGIPKRLVNFLLLFNIFIVGAFQYDELLNRMGIFNGYLLLPIIFSLHREKKEFVILADIVIVIFSIGLNLFGYVSVFSHMKLMY